MIEIDTFSSLGKAVIKTEIEAIQQLESRISEDFDTACQICLECTGRIVVLGMGKSGHIGSKIAATLASTGTPAFFVHPGEANHGDMGMITEHDVVLALSNSGETPEILSLLSLIKRLKVPMIALTGNKQSTLAIAADINLDISVDKEACPLGLAPTSSTTTTLVMGDALAIALLQTRGFTSADFALRHPGGALGRRLLLYIADIMHTGSEIPVVKTGCLLSEALVEITKKRFGMTAIVDADNTLLGIFTDGDLRRTLDNDHDVHKTKIEDVMTKDCLTIEAHTLAVNALQIMQDRSITSLLVVDDKNVPIGVVHMHDLLRVGVV